MSSVGVQRLLADRRAAGGVQRHVQKVCHRLREVTITLRRSAGSSNLGPALLTIPVVYDEME